MADDPLSTLAFAPDRQDEDDLQDTFPSRPAPAAHTGTRGSPDGDLQQTRVDEAMFSYDDMLGHLPSGSHAELLPEPVSEPPLQEERQHSPADTAPPRRAAAPAEAPAAAPPSPAGRSEALEISVSDPVKKAESSLIPGVSGGYMTYQVTTASKQPGFPHDPLSVRRRFRDFVALADLLKETHRGFFVPPRPDKNVVEGQRSAASFVEVRRAGLERYLQQLAAHPALAASKELRVFLSAEAPLGSNDEWQRLQPVHSSMLENVSRLPKQLLGQERSIPAPSEAVQSTKASGDLLRRFKELRESLRNEYSEPPMLTETEAQLRNERLGVEAFAGRLSTASVKAEKAVERFEESGAVLGDLGMALIRLAKFEAEQGAASAGYSVTAAASRSLAADCQRTGKAAVRLSRLSRTAEGQLTVALEPIHDHLALAPAISHALREREAALLTVQAITDERDKKKLAINTGDENSSDKNKARKAWALQNDIAALDAAEQAATGEYEKLCSRNQEELQRWRAGGVQEYAALLNSLLRVNLAFCTKTQAAWLEVAEEFGSAGQPLAGSRPVQ